MRAIVVDDFGPPERLRVGEVAEPVPGPDEVLVMVHTAPVNYVDLLVVGGSYQFLPPPLPFIPGKGPAGVVTGLGREVTNLRAGDRVLAMAEQSGYAEAVTVRADQCYRLQPSMSFTEAASLSLVYDTAWFALRERARLETGEIVLVLGASEATASRCAADGLLRARCRLVYAGRAGTGINEGSHEAGDDQTALDAWSTFALAVPYPFVECDLGVVIASEVHANARYGDFADVCTEQRFLRSEAFELGQPSKF